MPFSTFLRLQGDHHCACAQKWCHFSFFFKSFKQLKALRPKMTKIASRGSCLKVCDFALMQSAIAEKHTLGLEPGTHQLCTQSLQKVNMDNSKSNNNQSNNIQRLKLDKLRNSISTQATTQNIMLQKSC